MLWFFLALVFFAIASLWGGFVGADGTRRPFAWFGINWIPLGLCWTAYKAV